MTQNKQPDETSHSTNTAEAPKKDPRRKSPARPDQAGALRKQAEDLARKKNLREPENIESLSPEEIRRTLHELRVHQIQLEIQNEELRKTQDELDAARARYFDLYDLAPVGYITLSEKGLVLEGNLTAATLLGVARSALVKQPITHFIVNDDQDIFYMHRKRLLEGGSPQVCELRMVKKDGTSFWARLDATLVQAPSTGPVQAASTIGLTSPSPSDRCSGQTPSTIGLTSASHSDRCSKQADSVSSGGSPLEVPDKEAILERPMCRVILSDITERKQAAEAHWKFEQLDQKAQKLESLGLLAGGIAHDFNNLLGGIYGYIEIAKVTTNDDNISRCLSKALNTMNRARGLTHQLLTFSKGGTPIKKPGPLFPFVREIAQRALEDSDVVCSFDVPENLWSSNFDPDQIGQATENIVVNAKQAMPKGGVIEVVARNCSLTDKDAMSLPSGNYVKISFKDSGVGIPGEVLPRIFDPFFTTKETGHGLGLATCYSIINQHGGCIDVESETGKGSVFHVYLPAIKEPASSSVAGPIPSHKGSGTIVVMDDEEILRETVGNMLEFFGYTVVRAANGREAVDIFLNDFKKDRKIAGMIFDLTVAGGMGGKEAVTKVRKLDPDIPVFVSSGYDDDLVMANPAHYGFTDSICKPFSIEQLITMLNRYVKNGE